MSWSAGGPASLYFFCHEPGFAMNPGASKPAAMKRLARHWRAQPLYSGLLLIALLMRGLIPVGYMPAAGQGFFALQLCNAPQYRMAGWSHAADDGSTRHLAQSAGGHSSHAPAVHSANEHHSPTHSAGETLAHNSAPSPHEHHERTAPEHNTPCPFASAMLVALPSVDHVLAVDFDRQIELAQGEAQLAALRILPRAQSARAPPSFS